MEIISALIIVISVILIVLSIIEFDDLDWRPEWYFKWVVFGAVLAIAFALWIIRCSS